VLRTPQVNDPAFYSEGTNRWAMPRLPPSLITASGGVTTTCSGGSPCANSSALPLLPEISNDPDHASIVNVNGNNYMIVQFEQPQPAAMYALQLAQDSKSGALTPVPGTVTPVSWAAYDGLWFPCAGITTDWQTHLGSEEYPPDARQYQDVLNLATGATTGVIGTYKSYLTAGTPKAPSYALTELMNMAIFHHMRYYGASYYPDQLANAFTASPATAMTTINNVFNPYTFGYTTEIAVTSTTAGTGVSVQTNAVKHFSMGRIAFELALVLPDRKTAYLTDDGTNVGFFKYVATNAGDLSAGILSCAQMTRTSSSNGGSFNITWIPMTSSAVSDASIATFIAAPAGPGGKFSDIFNVAQPTNGVCPSGFLSVNQGSSYKSYDTGTSTLSFQECLQLNTATPNVQALAATLETRRYAGMLSCTTEFNKWEGITYSPARKQLYTALANIGSGMGATTSSSGVVNPLDVGGSQDVAVSSNPCGCVYVLPVDSTGTANTMYPLLCGTYGNATTTPAVTVDGSVAAGGQGCDVNGLSSPDGISYSADFDTLFIQEDTSTHQNDAMWQYTFPGPTVTTGGSLTRILAGPFGAELTSTYYQTIGNFSYIKTSVQHPYGESDQTKALDAGALGNTAATIGYIGPITVPKAATASTAVWATNTYQPYIPTASGAAAAASAAAALAVAGLAMLAVL
jgi:hypothetical protein